MAAVNDGLPSIASKLFMDIDEGTIEGLESIINWQLIERYERRRENSWAHLECFG